MKRIVFRVDSSTQMGSGHFMRCLTLAQKLQGWAESTFVSRNLQGNLNYLIEQHNYRLLQLPRMECCQQLTGYAKWLTVEAGIDADQTRAMMCGEPVDCLIIDHYALDEAWEKELRPQVSKIMVIDDLANRKHDCDILLDQNDYANLQARYKDLVPENCTLLLGSSYVLLREEFYQARPSMRVRDGTINNILVFFGGSDRTNETMKALRAIQTLDRPDLIVNAVVGNGNPHQDEVRAFCDHHPQMRFHCQIDYMAQLMNEADLAIGAGGSTTWERFCLGLPAIVIAIAENQVKISEDCHAAGYIAYLGAAEYQREEDLRMLLMKFIQNKEILRTMAETIGALHVGASCGKILDCIAE